MKHEEFIKKVFPKQIVGWCCFSDGKWGRVISLGKKLTEAVGLSGRVGRWLRKNMKKGTWVVTNRESKH